MSILEVSDIGIGFGGLTALDGVRFQVEPGEIFAVIGPNGAGKTTLFNVISGLYKPRRGRVLLAGRDVTGTPPHQLARLGLSRTFQNLQIFFRMTAIENVMVGRHLHERRNVLAHFFTLPSVAEQNRRTRAHAAGLLAVVGLSDAADRPAGSLPYGALKRLEIARALATEPKLLLLDEPAAGLSAMERTYFAEIVRGLPKDLTMVLIEHDMDLALRLVDYVSVLNHGRLLVEAEPAAIRTNEAVQEVYLGKPHYARRA